MGKGFLKIFHFLDKFCFANIFNILMDFAIKKFNFCKFANFLADSKRRAQELSNDVSFVLFGHQTWDLEGGQILVFKRWG